MDISPIKPPGFREAFRFWLKLGFISFGGPSGQIAIMHAELVEKRRWLSEARFLHALNFCMLLPGPEATQLAIYTGWLLHRTWGGLMAGSLFVLPSAFILWGLSLIYVQFGQLLWVTAIFEGLKPAVLAIVAAATLRLGQRALKNEVLWGLAALSFVALFIFKVPFPFVIVSAALIGWVGGKIWKAKFVLTDPANTDANLSVINDTDTSPAHPQPTLARALKVIFVSLILWWLPVFLIGGWLGQNHTLFREGIFFSQAAMVTFGGAYAVLPYVSQQAVEQFHWLSAGQMLDGLGLAETTPGPLIMVLQFVGFLGGWQHPGNLSPLLAATLGACITTWTTFVPCFLWIFLSAPHLEQMRGQRSLTTALTAVTAAVVGVILNLAVWFGLQVLWPTPSGVDWFALTIACITFIGLYKWRWEIIPVVSGAGALGLIHHLLLRAH